MNSKKTDRAPYTMVPNEIINDSTLHPMSFKLYCYMLSRPDTWKFWHNDLCKQLGIERRTLTKYLKDLIERRLINQHPIRENGQFKGFHYTVVQNMYTGGSHRSTFFTVRQSLHSAKNVPLNKTVLNNKTILNKERLNGKNDFSENFNEKSNLEEVYSDELWIEQNVMMRYTEMPYGEKVYAIDQWKLAMEGKPDLENYSIKNLRALLTKWMNSYQKNYSKDLKKSKPKEKQDYITQAYGS